MCVRGCRYSEADIQELIFRSRYSEAAGMCVSGIQKQQACVSAAADIQKLQVYV